VAPVTPVVDKLLFLEKTFWIYREDIKTILMPMASKANEPVGSMGADTPLPFYRRNPSFCTNIFKQLFAQITNPAIDPIREEMVMT